VNARPAHSTGRRGQMIVLFALALAAIVLSVGLVIDGGNALVQRRGAQNASDFAALAGARVIAEWVGGDTVNGSDANVRSAIDAAVRANGGTSVVFGAPNGPRYVDGSGALLGYVSTGAIPATTSGVTLTSNRSWRPYFLGIIGVSSWTATAAATANGGFCSACAPPPGTLFPAGISTSFFQTYPFCSGQVSNIPTDPCYPQHLTPGNLNVPGGFGWLKFGCDGYGLGQDPPQNAGGCQNNVPFLDTEIGPPSNSFGCCTAVGVAGLDRIGSLPGNKVSADCSYYITTGVTVTVPIWDTAGGTGSNAYYHIVGFAGFQITGCTGGKDIEGVWRKEFFLGPTTSTPPNPGVPGSLAIQLVK
jgi:Flp pilus assembly protein TadG